MDFGLRIATLIAGSGEVDHVGNFRFLEILLRCYSLYTCCCDEESEDIPQQVDEMASVASSIEDADSDDANCNTLSTDFQEVDNESLAMPKECPCLLKFWSKLCNDSCKVMNLLYSSSSHCTHVTEHVPFVQDKIYERVTRIAELIRVLSFNIEKLPVEETSAPLAVIKFVALLLSCHDSTLNSTGLIILSNIVSFAVQSRECEQFTFLQRTIYRRCVTLLVDSNDLHCLGQAFEVTTKLLTLGSESVTKEVTQLFDVKVKGKQFIFLIN